MAITVVVRATSHINRSDFSFFHTLHSFKYLKLLKPVFCTQVSNFHSIFIIFSCFVCSFLLKVQTLSSYGSSSCICNKETSSFLLKIQLYSRFIVVSSSSSWVSSKFHIHNPLPRKSGRFTTMVVKALVIMMRQSSLSTLSTMMTSQKSIVLRIDP